MRLTKKTDSTLVRNHGAPHFDGGRKWKRLYPFGEGDFEGQCGYKRRRFSLQAHEGLPRVGLGSFAQVVCTAPRLQVRACATSGQWLDTHLHDTMVWTYTS